MLKFRPSNITKKHISFNEVQLVALIEKALSDNSLRGYLYKRSSPNAKWRLKWFLLFENLLFYFDVGDKPLRASSEKQNAATSGGCSSAASSAAGASHFRSSNSASTQWNHPPLPAACNAQDTAQHTQKSPTKTSLMGSVFVRRTGNSSKQHQNLPNSAIADEECGDDDDDGEDGSGPNELRRDSLAERRRRRPSGRSDRIEESNSVAGDKDNAAGKDLDRNNNNNVEKVRDRAPIPMSMGSHVACNHHQNAPDSSSISGVSSHFLAHNEQTIGRSTTTSAGRTPIQVSANYDSLLSRKIGVIFLEGSYCERLIESANACAVGNGTSAAELADSRSSLDPTTAMACTCAQVASNVLATSTSTSTTTAAAANQQIGSTTSNCGGCYCSRTQRLNSTTSACDAQHCIHHPPHHHHSTTTATQNAPPRDNGDFRNANGDVMLLLQQQQQRQRCSAGQLDGSPAKAAAETCLTKTARAAHTLVQPNDQDEYESEQLRCMFTLKWRRAGSKEYQLRTETEAECVTWTHAISNARYSMLVNHKEQLEQKYLHLSQIVESESTAKWQYSRQCEELSAEVQRLRQEICLMKRQEGRSNHLRLVLAKSAALAESLRNRAAAVAANSSSNLNSSTDGRKQPTRRPLESSASTATMTNAMSQMQSLAGRLTGNNSINETTTTTTTTTAATTEPQRSSAAVAKLFSRARSVDAEQFEHEQAVRRAHRCRSAMLQHNRRQHQSQWIESSPLESSASATTSGRRSAPVGSTWSPSPPGANHAKVRPGETSLLRRQTGESLVRSRQQSIGLLRRLPTDQSADDLTTGSSGNNRNNRSIRDLSRASTRSTLHSTAPNDVVVDDRRRLSLELRSLVEAINSGLLLPENVLELENSEEMRKIKKVQSFFRGWLCRRRWKAIVQEYIKSPHAESMRKRNNLVFKMVECEEEYVGQLTLLISAFLRPIKMAASSQKPALSHDELNSIFLNSETLLFLHQIFLKGLGARMESWPTLVLGDLFNMLLPMLTIYQEYVRNHHFSLQVLAECKQREQFGAILRRLEEKPALSGRTLETFLTYPMHQIPRYIISLHEILAHTPHNHVERKSLYEAQTKLEELSRQMHDEVSETENIRQNLAIERMIIGGCDILLDVNQVFVRQGVLLQVVRARSRLSSFAARGSSALHYSGAIAANQTGGVAAAVAAAAASQQAHHLGGGLSSIFSTLSSNPFGATDSAATAGSHAHVARSHSGSAASVQANAAQQADSSSASGWQQAPAWGEPPAQLAYGAPTKELVRQCFLFTNHLLLCTRTKDGKLRLLDNIGKISLSEVTLIENPAEFLQQSSQTFHENRHPTNTGNARGSFVGRLSNYCATSSHLHQRNSSSSPNKYSSATQQRPDGASSEPRDSTVSAPPGKWSTPQHQPSSSCAPNRNASALEELSSSSYSASATPTKQHRSGIASYLANKLSNLTNFASGGSGSSSSQQQQQNSSSDQQNNPFAPMSAPSSPLNHKHRTSTSTTNSTSTQQQQQQPPKTWLLSSATSSSFPATVGRDYGGCDFILLFESSSSLSAAATATKSGSISIGASGSGGTVGAGSTGMPSSSAAVAAAAAASAVGCTANGSSSQLLDSGAPLCVGSGGAQSAVSGAFGLGFGLGLGFGSTQSAGSGGGPVYTGAIHLVAPSLQEKAAWMSDISQCIDNVHFNDLFHGAINDSASVTVNQSVRTDPRLHKDDIDIKFSRALNSCKLPQIRYASKERLFERLTDLRFLSIDFLNTFLLTYRVFTSAEDVLEALKSVHYNSDRYFSQSRTNNSNNPNAQMQPPGSARESFSIYANSSMSSLNTNPIGSSCVNILHQTSSNSRQLEQATQLQQQQQQQQLSNKRSNQQVNPNNQQPSVDTTNPTNGATTSLAATTATTTTTSTKQTTRPIIPPRLPQPMSASQARAQQLSQPSTPGCKGSRFQQIGSHIEDSFLLSPGMQTLSPANHQKRRSTISSLTPITGSTASSLANLTHTQAKVVQPTKMRSSATTTTTTQSTDPNRQTSPRGSDPSIEVQQISPAASSISCLSEREDPTFGSSRVNDNFFRVGASCVAEAETASGTISGSSSLGIDFGSGNGIHRVRSSSVCVQPGSRQRPKDVMDTLLVAPASASQISLTVPTGRQVRASSFSHVSDVSRLNDPILITKDLISSTSAEHWRLSYKKNCAAEAAAPTAGKSSILPGGTTHAPVATTRTIRWHLDPSSHGGSSINLGDKHLTGVSSSNNRRASADVRLRVTLETPADNEPTETPAVDPNQLYTVSPSVPPSTPIDPYLGEDPLKSTTQAEVSTGTGSAGTNGQKKGKTSQHRRTKEHASRLSGGSSESSCENIVKASSSSKDSLSSVSSQSTKSVVTSQSESGLIQTSSEPNSSDAETAARRGVANPSKSSVVQVNRADRKSGAETAKAQLKKLTQTSMIIKEIDLTQRSTIDCDTSADEDKIETTSSENSDEDEHEPIADRLQQVDEKSPPLVYNELSRRLESVALERDLDHSESNESRKQVKDGTGTDEDRSTGEHRQKREKRPALQQRQPPPTADKSMPTFDRETQTGTSLDEAAGMPTKVPHPSGQTTSSTKPAPVVQNAPMGQPKNSTSSCFTTPRSSFQHHTSEGQLAGVDRISKAGVVVTGSAPRVTSRRSSTASAASAFAAATAASNNPILTHPPAALRFGSTSVLGPIKSPASDFGGSTPTPHHIMSDANLASAEHCSCNMSQSQVSNQRLIHPMRLHFHHPSCAMSHLQQQQQPFTNQSDLSSQCNSRASSRLSSCAGLESSSQINAVHYAINQQQSGHFNNSACGSGRTSFSAAPVAHPATRTPSAMSSVGRLSKRNSAQINVRSVATIRVLSVMRHWVSKHSQDFINDTKLSYLVQEFLQELISDPNLLPAEHKAALQLQQMVQKAAYSRTSQVDLDILLAPPTKPSPDSIETLSALEIAEGMTYLDHKIFLAIRSEEFLGQAWMKADKAIKAPHILLITKRFNDVSRLVSSEIIRVPELHRRVAIIEKWANVAHICRVVHNFNGVLQICAAFTNSAVFRLKKTWEKIPKTTKTTIDQLQNLVSTDSRFRNMRDAISRCDPPSIPYVGMYLTDLSFIEEGTPNYSPEGLLNFSKMRMIAHVIREIQHLQNGNYKIDLNPRVANYLLDSSRHLQDDEMYRCSLAIEPRYSGNKNNGQNLNNQTTNQSTSSVNNTSSSQQALNSGHLHSLR